MRTLEIDEFPAGSIAAVPVRARARARRVGRRILLMVALLTLLAMIVGPLVYRVDPLEQRLAARLAPPASE